MNRRQFILKLIDKFKTAFKDRDVENIVEEYMIVLRPEWNYEKLYSLFIQDYEKSMTPPPPSYFIKFTSQVRTALLPPEMAFDKKEALKEVADYCNRLYSLPYSEHLKEKAKMPEKIKFLVKKYSLTPEMINQQRITDEVLNA